MSTWLNYKRIKKLLAERGEVTIHPAPPTVGDDMDAGFSIGSRWTDSTTLIEYVCIDNSRGAAIWAPDAGEGDTVLAGVLSVEEDRIAYVDSDEGSDLTGAVGSPYTPFATIKAACTAAYTMWYDDHVLYVGLSGQVDQHSNLDERYRTLVYVKKGVYKENEVNNYRNDIYLEAGTLIWEDTGSRSIISDRHLGSGYTITKVWAYGSTFIHKITNGASDQQSINLRRASVYEQYGGMIDDPQIWAASTPQKCTFVNAISLGGNAGYSREYNTLYWLRSTIKNGLYLAPANAARVNSVYQDCIFELPKRAFLPSFYDENGSLIFKWSPTGSSFLNYNSQQTSEYMLYDGTAINAPVTGTNGDGIITHKGNDYPIVFNTDIDTTITDFIDTNLAAIKAYHSYDNVRRIKKVTLTGSSGTANINVDGTNYLATFNTDLPTTAVDFVATHQVALNAAGYDVVNRVSTGDLYIKKNTDGEFTLTVTNVVPDLAGTIDVMLRFENTMCDQIYDIISYANVSGDLDVDVTVQAITAPQLRETDIVQNNTGSGRTGMGATVYTGGIQNGRISILNSVFNLYKAKSWGLFYRPISEETVGREGFIELDGITFRDYSGGSGDLGTTAIITGGTSTLTNPKILKLGAIEWTTDVGIMNQAAFPNPKIWSPNMPTINTLVEFAVLDNFSATAAPLVTDDEASGYSIGSKWYDSTNDDLYECVDNTVGSAIWKLISSSKFNPAAFDTVLYMDADLATSGDGSIGAPFNTWVDTFAAIEANPADNYLIYASGNDSDAELTVSTAISGEVVVVGDGRTSTKFPSLVFVGASTVTMGRLTLKDIVVVKAPQMAAVTEYIDVLFLIKCVIEGGFTGGELAYVNNLIMEDTFITDSGGPDTTAFEPATTSTGVALVDNTLVKLGGSLVLGNALVYDTVKISNYTQENNANGNLQISADSLITLTNLNCNVLTIDGNAAAATTVIQSKAGSVAITAGASLAVDGPIVPIVVTGAAPGAGDDELDGYHPGSLWYDNTGGSGAFNLHIAESVAAGAAVWRQVTIV